MEISSRLKDVLVTLDPPEGYQCWHGGPSLLDCLNQVDVELAIWKLSSNYNSIWDLVLHMVFWKHEIIRLLDHQTTNEFDRSPANFPALPKMTLKNWQADRDLLMKTHHILIKKIKGFPAEKLDVICPEKNNWTYMQLISGISDHDVYHIGQIQLIKKSFQELNS